MARYKFKHRYEADLRLRGDGTPKRIEAQEGDVIDLDDDEAAFIERDSPGAIVRMKSKAKDAKADEDVPADRMVKRGRVRKDRQGDESDKGAMTSADVATVVKE